jgi:regulator of RNase E activity RraA
MEYLNKLSSFPSALVSDCLQRFNILSGLKPISRKRSFCGVAFTVEEYEGSNETIHLSCSRISQGDVFVVSAGALQSRSVWGGVLNALAAVRGAAAVVIDGMVRDLDEIIESQHPVYAKGITPAGPVKSGLGNVNIDVSIGGSVVAPGDILIGDSDGIVVIPKETDLKKLIDDCYKRIEMEKNMKEFMIKNKYSPLSEKYLQK